MAGLSSTASATRLPQQDAAPTEVTFELSSSQGAIDVPVKGRFFGKRAKLRSDTITLQGRALHGPNEAGPFEIGNTDFVLSVIGPPDEPDGVATYPLQAADFDWRSVSKLKVKVGTKIQRWKVSMRPSRVAPQPIGDITFTPGGEPGGSFDAEWGLLPRYVFKGPGDRRRVFDAGGATNPDLKTILLTADDANWTFPCPGLIPPLTDDLCFGGPDQPWEAGGPTGNFAFMPAVEVSGPPAEIDPSAEVSPDATIGSAAVIGPGAVVGPGAYIGPRAVLSSDVTVSPDAIVGADSQLGPGVYLEDGAVIGSDAIVGEGAQFQLGAAADDGATIGDGAFFEFGAFLGPGSSIGAGAILGDGSRTGAGVSIGPGALLLPDVFVASGAVVLAETLVAEDLITCEFPGGESFVTSGGACGESSGSVFECAPTLFEAGADPPGQQLQPGTPTGATRTKLDQDVDSGNVAVNGGGMPYVADTHDCDDFAEDLELHLQGLGYNATFTCYWKLNPDNAWWKFWQKKWIEGHCVTDVHLPDGTTVFIEPQLTSGEGAVGQDLDFDGDGKVEVSNGPTSDTTDDSYRIEVYDSAQAARDAGVVLD
jgi:acetyltransferase-like isoleucine patch superfamily enzyme